jgi:hypothetical protein
MADGGVYKNYGKHKIENYLYLKDGTKVFVKEGYYMYPSTDGVASEGIYYSVKFPNGEEKNVSVDDIVFSINAPQNYSGFEKGGYMADGGGVGRIVMIPTFVAKEINDSVKMGYDRLVEGMIGRKRKGVMLINEDFEVRGTYDIGLKDSIQNIIDKVKSGTFKVDAIDSKMASGGKVKFADKVKSVQESLLKRKKVSPKVQKDYGKTYSKAEAKESAQRIVGSRMAQLKEKMAKKKK